jgi:sugar lactone lactonase YvrE
VVNRILQTVLAVGVVLLLVGCASAPRKKESLIFYPPPPELPRIQFLTSFSGLKDIEEQSSFNRFVVGEKQDRRLDKPYGVGMFDGKIYVCDTNDTVVVIDLKAKTYGPLKGAAGEGRLIEPQNISIAADGTKYVADPGRGQIVVYNRDDEYIRAYGNPDTWRPVDAAAFEDRLYVADMKVGVVKVLDLQSGEVVKTMGDKGDADSRLAMPTNLTFDREGYLYVTDVARFQVVKFDRDGHFKQAFGRLGDNLGHFARPRGTALDREGRLYAVDAAFNNVQIFSKEGWLLLFFGKAGDAEGDFLLPAKVVIDYDDLQYFKKYLQPDFEAEYLILVTSQFGPHRVNVLAFGKQKGKRYPTEQEILDLINKRRQEELRKQQQQKQEAPQPEHDPTTDQEKPLPPG